MRRRDFIAGLGATAAWPHGARAQEPKRLPTIGFLGGTTPAQMIEMRSAFVQRLRELGWIEGRTVAIEYRWAEGLAERADEFAAEFVRLKVDVILSTGNEFSLIAKRATSTIPIVFAVAGDPVGTGLVASLAQPGGNATGLSNQLTDGAGKRVELLCEILPTLSRLAIVTHLNPLSKREADEAKAAANTRGLEAVILEVQQREDVTRGFDTVKDRVDALYVTNSSFLVANRQRITNPALSARLPTMFGSRDWLDGGGLMYFGANFPQRFRRSADYVDKILRGTKPADIPVEQPTKFDFGINLITAKAIGLTIPESVLLRADEVIE